MAKSTKKAGRRKAVAKAAPKATPSLASRAGAAARRLKTALKKLQGSRTVKLAAAAAAAGLVAVAGLAARKSKKKRRW